MSAPLPSPEEAVLAWCQRRGTIWTDPVRADLASLLRADRAAVREECCQRFVNRASQLDRLADADIGDAMTMSEKHAARNRGVGQGRRFAAEWIRLEAAAIRAGGERP